MFQIDLKSHKSIQEQITDNFKELMVTGVLAPDEKLPSVRIYLCSQGKGFLCFQCKKNGCG